MGVTVSVIGAVTGAVSAAASLVKAFKSAHSAKLIKPNPVVKELEVRLKKEEQRVEAERCRADERIAEERRRVDEERRRMDDERRRIDDERRRMSDEKKREAIEKERKEKTAEDQKKAEKKRADEKKVAEKKRADEKKAEVRKAGDTRKAEVERKMEGKQEPKEEKEGADGQMEKRRPEEVKKEGKEGQVKEKTNQSSDTGTETKDAARADEGNRDSSPMRKADEPKSPAKPENVKVDTNGGSGSRSKNVPSANKTGGGKKSQTSKAQEVKKKNVRAQDEARIVMSDAEKQLREGVRPEIMPTRKDMEARKKELDYREELFHFAIAGTSGSGKSSLINALRGLTNYDKGAAPTGIIETTNNTQRYPDPNPTNPFVWYDIPGAGTLKSPGAQYFNDKGLYVFDGIILLFDIRFTETDVAILQNAALYNIPVYIVRSKSNQHIQNIAEDMGFDLHGGRMTAEDRNAAYETARDMYVEQTRKSVAQNLRLAGLIEQRVYFVSKDVLQKFINPPANQTLFAEIETLRALLDEVDLLKDLLDEAKKRRMPETK